MILGRHQKINDYLKLIALILIEVKSMYINYYSLSRKTIIIYQFT